MPGLPMTFACGLYDRMLALQTGDIKPEGIDLNFLVIDNPREIFDRMSNRLEFDACEMSSSEYVSRLAAKKLPFVALPVFASRVFRHGFIVVNRKFITTAKDLAGKRIGVPLYTQTAAIFIRGLMQHDLGVDLGGIEWVEGAVNEPGRYGQPSVMPLSCARSISCRTIAANRLAIFWRPAKSTPLSAPIRRARSTGIPPSCGCFPTIAPASRIISAAPKSFRSCI